MIDCPGCIKRDAQLADLMKYIEDAKMAGAGDRVSGEPLADYIRRLRDELEDLKP